MAREEHQKQEQQHLNDKQVLTNQLHDKDKQYQQLIRDTKATQSGKRRYQFKFKICTRIPKYHLSIRQLRK